MGFVSFSHDRQLDVGGPARTIRCTNLTESFFISALWSYDAMLQTFKMPIVYKNCASVQFVLDFLLNLIYFDVFMLS